jgi:apolipoprotein D and lipocalin family protein
MKVRNSLIVLFCVWAGSSFAQGMDPLTTVAKVDLARYAGKWHQIAYYPTRFQKNCEVNVTAEYTLNADGTVKVRNECFKLNGTRKAIIGTARVVNVETNAELKVKFFWFAPAGDYWIVDLGADYEYAVVSEPKRKFMWVLSRAPQMPKAQYEAILERVAAKGLSPERIKLTSELLP